MQKHEFSVDMTCEGCAEAVSRVLNKLGGEWLSLEMGWGACHMGVVFRCLRPGRICCVAAQPGLTVKRKCVCLCALAYTGMDAFVLQTPPPLPSLVLFLRQSSSCPRTYHIDWS